MLSFFQLPKGVLHILDYFRSRFFWQGDSERKKYRLPKWSVHCRPKDQGGLGIHDLDVKNRALLDKWLFKLLMEDGVWQTLLRRKCVGSKAVSQVYWKPGDSHFWAGIMAKKYFFYYGSFSIMDGSEIRFWEDKCLGDATIQEQYPALYNIVCHKGDTITTVMESFPPNVMFRRDLIGHRLQPWNILLQRLSMVQLSHESDIFRWNLHGNGQFSDV